MTGRNSDDEPRPLSEEDFTRACEALLKLSTHTIVPMSTAFLAKRIKEVEESVKQALAESARHDTRLNKAADVVAQLVAEMKTISSQMSILRGEMNTLSQLVRGPDGKKTADVS